MLSGLFGVESWECLLLMETWWLLAYSSRADIMALLLWTALGDGEQVLGEGPCFYRH